MNHTTIALALIVSCYTYAETKDNHYYKNNTSTFLGSNGTNTLNNYFKKLEYPTAKPIVAATSISLGSYLLYGTIQTAIDLQDLPQQNSNKGLLLNAAIATGLIVAGSYFLKQVLDEKNFKQDC